MLCRCPEGSGVHPKCFADVWKVAESIGGACRYLEAIEYIWYAVLKILESIRCALQMSRSHGLYPRCFSDVLKVLESIEGAL